MSDQEQTQIQERASRMGWVDKDAFRGDPEKWIDAEAFIKRGDEELPILRERNKALDAKYQKLARDFEEVRDTLKQFAEHHKNVSKREYEKAKAELQRQEKEAVSLADTKKFDAIQLEKAELEKLKPEDTNGTPTQSKAGSKEDYKCFEAWKKDAPWWEKDRAMTAYAKDVANELERNSPHLVATDEFYAEVTKAVKEEFPHKFENPKRKEAGLVHDGSDETSSGSGKKKKTYNDLPADAKAYCDKFLKQGLFKDKQAYVDEYFGQE